MSNWWEDLTPEAAAAALSSFSNEATFGLSDEIGAGAQHASEWLGNKLGFGSRQNLDPTPYNVAKTQVQQDTAKLAEEHPVADVVGTVAGITGTMAAPGGVGAKAARAIGKGGAKRALARAAAHLTGGAAEGAGYSAARAYGDDTDISDAAVTGGTVSGALSAVVPAARGVRNIVREGAGDAARGLHVGALKLDAEDIRRLADDFPTAGNKSRLTEALELAREKGLGTKYGVHEGGEEVARQVQRAGEEGVDAVRGAAGRIPRQKVANQLIGEVVDPLQQAGTRAGVARAQQASQEAQQMIDQQLAQGPEHLSLTDLEGIESALGQAGEFADQRLVAPIQGVYRQLAEDLASKAGGQDYTKAKQMRELGSLVADRMRAGALPGPLKPDIKLRDLGSAGVGAAVGGPVGAAVAVPLAKLMRNRGQNEAATMAYGLSDFLGKPAFAAMENAASAQIPRLVARSERAGNDALSGLGDDEEWEDNETFWGDVKGDTAAAPADSTTSTDDDWEDNETFWVDAEKKEKDK